MSESFKVGDRVFVTNARVHHYTGTVIGILARRVRVEFPFGGYNNAPYIEDFYPRQLTMEARVRRGSRPATIRTEPRRGTEMTIEEEIARVVEENAVVPESDARQVAAALSPLLNRVRAEAVKEFRVNDLRDRAERADERWKAWGDVNDAELRDRLFQQAAAIEQNSEGRIE